MCVPGIATPVFVFGETRIIVYWSGTSLNLICLDGNILFSADETFTITEKDYKNKKYILQYKKAIII